MFVTWHLPIPQILCFTMHLMSPTPPQNLEVTLLVYRWSGLMHGCLGWSFNCIHLVVFVYTFIQYTVSCGNMFICCYRAWFSLLYNNLWSPDGVVLVDPDYLKDRKVFSHVLAAFRYGREDLDVLGLAFRKDLFLATQQVYPPPNVDTTKPLTRLQERLIKKLGANAYPFFFEVMH